MHSLSKLQPEQLWQSSSSRKHGNIQDFFIRMTCDTCQFSCRSNIAQTYRSWDRSKHEPNRDTDYQSQSLRESNSYYSVSMGRMSGEEYGGSDSAAENSKETELGEAELEAVMLLNSLLGLRTPAPLSPRRHTRWWEKLRLNLHLAKGTKQGNMDIIIRLLSYILIPAHIRG